MDGLLLIDKPGGPTSHDVVQRMRRSSGERRIGHTGTLDPAATGLLPLVFGRATRLAPFISGAVKTYEAAIRLGVATDTDDADGRPMGAPAAPAADDAIARALETFRGTFDQIPPAHSAKKIGGQKAYELARRAEPVALKPVTVTVLALDWLSRDGDLVRIRVRATAGFYVRALARDLGARLGCGGHLFSLRRTASGAFTVDRALPLEDAERLGAGVGARLLSPADALPELTAVAATEHGLQRVRHGNPLGPEHTASPLPALRPDGSPIAADPIKILAPDGQLVAVARARGGALHPVVVLG